ncbi:MAG: response regulator [Brevundimonas sp. 32-68-21]|jgi:CheY-like chemotaxis protein|uniref:Response regulator n=1 Tax=Brevundimonas mediterranea TaxID=74329 RepID=A0AB37E5R9_9CAUL|nr:MULTISPECIES: response regulator [Brevundimonas]EDX80900.1 hypothetical protein BBAL3_2057 [Brevundimonas sp. BAL3]OYX73958.1 MAG: response regulator [Brevundimonas sp. 32-68-21]QIH72335.1 response regulator [Brevundimonas mediterranea]TAJ38109.1 MAG: response regulator [Brevundimonas sp.]
MLSNSMPAPPEAAADAPHVLVVEDEFLIRMLVSDHLRDVGFVVIEAFNADEAVAILKSGACIDLIFTDVRMPGAMDGLGLLAYAQLGQPRIPVLVSSGHLEPETAYAGGAAGFLPKPCDLDVLVVAMRTALAAAA